MSPDGSRLVFFRRAPAHLGRPALEKFARQLRDEAASGRSFECLIPADRDPQPGGFLGEIAISGQRAAEQAERFGHGPEEEIRILMLHGVLHLTGLDHETDRGRMRRAETAWRRKLGLPAGLVERVRS